MKLSKQQERVLKYLKANRSITPLHAWKVCGVYRLSAVIFELRALGLNIETQRKGFLNQFGEKVMLADYVLKETKNGDERIMGRNAGCGTD